MMTSTVPEAMRPGVVAVIDVLPLTVKVASVPPNVTFVTFVNALPVMVTVWPPASGPLLGDSDEGTQVSFGFVADSFSAFKWWGAFLVPCLLMAAFVMIYRLLTGPLDRNVWCAF